MNKKIDFDYEGKHYTLEYTRDSIKYMEANGFILEQFMEKPATMLDLAWKGAFYKNHRKENAATIEKILSDMDERDNLHKGLGDMINETYRIILEGDENSKKVQWKIS